MRGARTGTAHGENGKRRPARDGTLRPRRRSDATDDAAIAARRLFADLKIETSRERRARGMNRSCFDGPNVSAFDFIGPNYIFTIPAASCAFYLLAPTRGTDTQVNLAIWLIRIRFFT